MSQRVIRKDRLAELVSMGLELPDAAARMGVTRNYVYALWAEIKRELGPQAQ